MASRKWSHIDLDTLPVRIFIDGDPKEKTLEEIQAYLTKTIKVDIEGIPEGIYKLNDLLSEKPVKLKKDTVKR